MLPDKRDNDHRTNRHRRFTPAKTDIILFFLPLCRKDKINE
jgi:hypothetical protein